MDGTFHRDYYNLLRSYEMGCVVVVNKSWEERGYVQLKEKESVYM